MSDEFSKVDAIAKLDLLSAVATAYGLLESKIQGMIVVSEALSLIFSSRCLSRLISLWVFVLNPDASHLMGRVLRSTTDPVWTVPRQAVPQETPEEGM